MWKFENAIPPLGTITEGPAWDGERILFSNISMNRILSLSPDTFRVSLFAENTAGVNGLNFNSQGELFGCSGDGRAIVQFTSDGQMTTVVDRLNGRRINGPNDIAIHPSGRLYFSDRIGDVYAGMGVEHSSILSADPQPNGGYRCVRRTYDTTMPNGLLFSKDYSVLYVAQSDYRAVERRELRAYEVNPDGSLGKYEMLHDFGPHRGIDGMALTDNGLIVACTGWEVSGPGGCVTVFEPNGRIIYTHRTPATRPTNCAFVGNILYVTSIEGHLLRTETELKGWVLWPNAEA